MVKSFELLTLLGLLGLLQGEWSHRSLLDRHEALILSLVLRRILLLHRTLVQEVWHHKLVSCLLIRVKLLKIGIRQVSRLALGLEGSKELRRCARISLQGRFISRILVACVHVDHI
jgi:hypothetical protein